MNVASPAWIQNIAKLANTRGILLIVDEIQAGCGRSGDFFSFESLGLMPDIICLAKSISGFGLPMSLVLLKPEYDRWKPGEHNGTFQGHNLAFVTATEAIRRFWHEPSFKKGIHHRMEKIHSFLQELARIHSDQLSFKGRGMMTGLACCDPQLAHSVQQECFSQGLMVELCGPRDEVVKLLPPLNISWDVLEQGLDILATVIRNTLQGSKHLTPEAA